MVVTRQQARNSKPKQRITVDIDKETMQGLDRLRDQEGISRAAIIARFIAQGLRQHEQQGAAA